MKNWLKDLTILLAIAMPGTVLAEQYMYAGDFLGLGVGARSLGMGGTGSTQPAEGSALYWNPAALGFSEKSQVSAMHCSAFDGLSMYDYLGGHTRVGEWAFGAAWLRLGVDDIILTHFEDASDPERRPVVDKIISWSENAIYLSGARALNTQLAVGLNAKVIIQGGGDYSSFGFSPDLGIFWKPAEGWDTALSLHDVAGSIKWSTGAQDKINMFARPAIRYTFALDEDSKHLLALAGEADVWFLDYGTAAQVTSSGFSADLKAGAEWSYGLFALRGGVDAGHPTAGAGLHWQMFQADYAFLSSGELGISHRVSAGVSF